MVRAWGVAVVGGMLMTMTLMVKLNDSMTFTRRMVGAASMRVRIRIPRSRFAGVSMGRLPRTITRTITGGCRNTAVGRTCMTRGRDNGICGMVLAAGSSRRMAILVGRGNRRIGRWDGASGMMWVARGGSQFIVGQRFFICLVF